MTLPHAFGVISRGAAPSLIGVVFLSATCAMRTVRRTHAKQIEETRIIRSVELDLQTDGEGTIDGLREACFAYKNIFLSRSMPRIREAGC